MAVLEAWAAGGAARGAGAGHDLRLHREQTLALHFLARELAGAADGFRFLPGSLFGGFLVMAAQLHLAEDALALHLFLQRLEGLVDIVVTDENLHAGIPLGLAGCNSSSGSARRNGQTARNPRHLAGPVTERARKVHRRRAAIAS